MGQDFNAAANQTPASFILQVVGGVQISPIVQLSIASECGRIISSLSPV